MKWQIDTKVRNTQTGDRGKVTGLKKIAGEIFCDITRSNGGLDRAPQATLEYHGWRAIE